MVQTTPTGTVHNGQSPGNPNSWVLVTAAQAGDRDAFGQPYARYAGGVSRFVGHRLRDRGAVEDLTSETFTRALRRIDSVSDQGRDVGAWFTTIARNLVLDHVKCSRHRLETTTAEITAAMGRGQGAVKALTHRAIVGLRAAMTGDDTTPVARAAAGRELPAAPGGVADEPRGADPLDRARRAVGEVRQHREAADRHAVGERGRTQQVSRWHAQDRTSTQHQEHDQGGLAMVADGGAR